MNYRILTLVLCSGLGGALCTLWAQEQGKALRLPSILSDHMVLQQGKNTQIWGWASPGSPVKVAISGQEKTATANRDGRWKVALDPLRVGEVPLEMRVSSGSETREIRDILVGEVWLCSGQSNMQIALHQAANSSAEIKQAAYPEIRFFVTGFHAPAHPDEDCTGQWVACSPQTAASFSAIGYFFGRDLHQELKAPVGLILSAQGATAAESWISRQALASEPVLQPIVDSLARRVIDPKGWDMHLPSGLFNGRIAPLAPLSIRGVIWYQGETNASRAWQYRKLFPLLIRDWRKQWGEDLPFYFVQLANYQKPPSEPVNEAWAELREAQALALQLPNTGMAVAIDIGEEKDIHPKNKLEVGKRLAALALAKTYGRKVVDSGPLYQSMKVEGNKIRTTFATNSGGLVAKGDKLQQFAIAGADRKFVWADAVIDGDSILVSNPQVTAPIAVRYAWANNPAGSNLYNTAGFPAAPFRTDDWPGVTETAHLPKPGSSPAPASLPLADCLLPASVGMTGNTIAIDLDAAVERGWDKIKVNGYAYGLSQKKEASGETHLWLPYGYERGWYYEIKGALLESTQPGVPAAFVCANSSQPVSLVLKFHFDRPIRSFRLSCGPVEFQPVNAAAGLEYSVDGHEWKPITETSQGGTINQWVKSQGAKFDHPETQDLFLRCYVRDKNDPAKLDPGTCFRARMAGDVMWGDASSTFAQAQWQLWVTPAQ